MVTEEEGKKLIQLSFTIWRNVQLTLISMCTQLDRELKENCWFWVFSLMSSACWRSLALGDSVIMFSEAWLLGTVSLCFQKPGSWGQCHYVFRSLVLGDSVIMFSEAWLCYCNYVLRRLTPSLFCLEWTRNGHYEPDHWKFQRLHKENCWEMGWRAYGLAPVQRYFELKWSERVVPDEGLISVDVWREFCKKTNDLMKGWSLVNGSLMWLFEENFVLKGGL